VAAPPGQPEGLRGSRDCVTLSARADMHGRRLTLVFVTLLLGHAGWNVSVSRAQRMPNVVIIYTDDLGYGDVSSYGAAALQTPNIDRLAREGVRFTDAHSAAATCTPSRYAMLTGQYAWRRRGTAILPGDAGLVIEPGRTTLATIFERSGYAAAVVGKWHLGLGPAGGPDWNGLVSPGPREIGFGYSFIMAATGDRVPTVYVENGRVVGLDPNDPIRVSYAAPLDQAPIGKTNPELLKLHPSHGHDQTIVNGISRIGYMTGGKAALWKDEDMADVFTSHAVNFIERNRTQPFFLYFAPTIRTCHACRIHGLSAGLDWARGAMRSPRQIGASGRFWRRSTGWSSHARHSCSSRATTGPSSTMAIVTTP
jgi:hypothetical protein